MILDEIQPCVWSDRRVFGFQNYDDIISLDIVVMGKGMEWRNARRRFTASSEIGEFIGDNPKLGRIPSFWRTHPIIAAACLATLQGSTGNQSWEAIERKETLLKSLFGTSLIEVRGKRIDTCLCAWRSSTNVY
jgi:4-aminobutyrate aminotransferase-like enzyme